MDKKDHAMAIIKAGISSIPVIGNPLSSLISDYIPSATQKSLEYALKSIEEKLNDFGDRIDSINVEKEEFSEIFKSTYNILLKTHKKKKIDIATSLIANTLLKSSDIEKLSFNEADHFLKCIEQLSIGAIEVLAEATKIIYKSYHDSEVTVSYKHMQAYQFEFSLLSSKFIDYDPSLIMGLIGELDSLNLIHKKGFPDMPTPDYGNYPLELTSLGLRFVKYLMKNEEPEINHEYI